VAKTAIAAAQRKGHAADEPRESQKTGRPGISDKVNINEAAAEELRSLPGIGPVLSDAIIAYRETNGPFRDVEELTRVKGIGRKRFESVRDFVTVSR
jgi:competence protein ComEA